MSKQSEAHKAARAHARAEREAEKARLEATTVLETINEDGFEFQIAQFTNRPNLFKLEVKSIKNTWRKIDVYLSLEIARHAAQQIIANDTPLMKKRRAARIAGFQKHGK